MATVEGDIHDIGKNIVCLMLKNHGFEVIDLGKDVPAARIVEAAEKAKAAVIGLSALMTTTMLQNVRQYYVSNEKVGQLFVIEGKAVNNFKTPKEMIKLEATLFDEKGGSLATQDTLAGNTVSLFQLQVMAAAKASSSRLSSWPMSGGSFVSDHLERVRAASSWALAA